MQQIYLTEIHSDDEPDLEHDGEEVEQLQPIEVPIETLTAKQVATAKNAVPAGGGEEQAAERARQHGNTAFGAGRFDDAVAAYSEAIDLWPAGAGLAFGNRSAAQLKLQRVEPAISDATEMARLLPALAKSHFRLGSALAAGGRHAEAAGAFAEMLRLDPGSEAAEEALRKQMLSGNLKKNKKHARLLQTCNEALAARRAHEKSAAAAAAAAAAEPPPPARGPPLRLHWGKPVVPARGAARPAKRSGATLSAVGGRLWLLGGADREAHVHGDVWEYVPPAATPPPVSDSGGGGGGGWVLHAAASAPPFTPRAAHAAAARAADSLLLFGGHNPHTSTLHGDLLELRVGRRGELDAPPAWRQPAVGGVAPDARNGHSLTWDAEGSAALLFGGADDTGHRNDLHALHIIVGGEGVPPEAEVWEWRNPLCTGAPPPAREMHAAALLGRALLLHGGRGGPHAAAALDELSVLCLRSLAWSSTPTRLTRSGHCATPLPRPAAAAAATDGADAGADADATAPRCLLLGGFDGGSVKHDAWQLVLPAGAAAGGTVAAADVLVERGRSEDAPPGRFSHAACVLEGELEGGQQRAGARAEVFLFGGSSFETELDDLVPAALG